MRSTDEIITFTIPMYLGTQDADVIIEGKATVNMKRWIEHHDEGPGEPMCEASCSRDCIEFNVTDPVNECEITLTPESEELVYEAIFNKIEATEV